MTPLALALLAAAPSALPNVDAFWDVEPPTSRAVEARVLQPAAFLGHVEPRLGVPSVLWAPAFGAQAPAWTRADLGFPEAARRHLLEHARAYRLSAADVARLELRAVHDVGVGAVVVSFARSVDGVPLFRDALHVVLTRRRELVAFTGFVNPARRETAAALRFRLQASTAVELAAREGLERSVQAEGGAVPSAAEGGWRRLTAPGLVTARARQVWFGLADALEPAWQVELGADDGRATLVVVSAHDGRLLSRKNLTEDAQATYRVWAQPQAPFTPLDGPFGDGVTPHPTGARLPALDPVEVPPALVSLDFGPSTRGDVWLAAGATALTTNNVDVFADLYPPAGFNPPNGLLPDGGLLRLPDGGAPPADVRAGTLTPLRFDAEYRFDAGAFEPGQLAAASTQLFFTVNWLHDWLYDVGFDERAGNGQRDNLGRGGLAGDAVVASTHDYTRPDNASMSTFGDGEASQLRMGNFNGFGPYGVTLPLLADGGSPLAVRTNLGPVAFDVTAPLAALVDADGGVGGCGPLAAPEAVQGKVALSVGAGCGVRERALAAQDAGAVGLLVALVAPTSAFYGVTTSPAANGTELPTLAVTGRDGQLALDALDGGAALTARLLQALAAPRPSSLDNGITAHEYGHFLSNRLISDAAGLSLQISRSLGEGWSDFLTLLLAARATDAQLGANADWRGAFPVGVWAMAGRDRFGAPFQHAWYGERRWPYSRDLAVNGLSFRHLRDGATLPPFAQVLSPVNSEVHNAGELWAATLWDCFTALLVEEQQPFDAAHAFMLRALVGSLKATPSNPDYLEARDALLAVALAERPSAFTAMYRAFARRGMGPRALAPSKLSLANSPVVEDTGVAPYVRVTRATLDDDVRWCDRDGVLDVGEAGRLTLRARNLSPAAMTEPFAVQVTPLTRGVQVVGAATTTFMPAQPFEETQASLVVTLTEAAGPQQLEFRVDTVGASAAQPTLVTVLANTDVEAGLVDDFEVPLALDRGAGWRRGDDLVVSGAAVEQWQALPLTPLSTVLWGPNAGSRGHSWVTTPALAVGAGDFTLRFRHHWQLEQSLNTQWDGAYLEVSDDGQQTWQRVEGAALAPAYSGVITAVFATDGTPTTNPEPGRPAWVGTSAGYPAWVSQSVSFGQRFAGKTVHLRFVIATDQSAGLAGWELDDVEVSGVTGAPFQRRVGDRKRCVNRAPTVSAPPPLQVSERSPCTLAVTTADPDGDSVSVSYLQRSGPQVALSGATFTAPEVTAETPLTFEARATDGQALATALVTVLVEPVNRPPTLVATAAPEALRAGELVTLTAEVEDPDGDTVEVSWVQLRGPLAQERAPGVYVMPKTPEAARLVFQATASDGQAVVTAEVDVGLEPVSCGCSASGGAGWLALAWALRRARRRRPA